jgi:hypothetical protein
MPNTSPATAEDAIRRYLLSIENPDSLRDDEEIARLRVEAESATDPLERLRVFAALDRAENPDTASLEAGFITHAATYAAQHNIPASAFASLGVPQATLAAAKLAPGRRQAPKTRTRRPRTSSDTVASSLPAKPFTAADLAELSGATLATARKVIADLTSAGLVETAEAPESWEGRGRVPTFYRPVKH